jgi:hypothetical protein
MRIEPLHRRIVMDARVLHERIHDIFPAELPAAYRDRAINIGAFIKRLNALTRPLNIYNEISDDRTARQTSISFSGEWLPECMLPANNESADIRIYWILHPRGHRQKFTAQDWQYAHFVFWTVVMHELAHRHQDVYRGETRTARVYRPHSSDASIQKDQLYLGDFDEIEAHAHDIAVEALHYYPELSLSAALTEMREPVEVPATTYPIYLKTFKNSAQHPALAVLHRKIRHWYTVMKRNLDFYRTLELF